MYGLKLDWAPEPKTRCYVLDDYKGGEPRWCPGCGDFAVLAAIQRLTRDEQIPPEQIAVVSGIGCSSRFPHYMKTYGFHGLHGRAFPVAEGVRCRRPDLHVFVVTGDGDCCAIGTSHWIHAIRYNMKMVVMLFDNNIYGLTKAQTSPTTKLNKWSNTHPRGTILSPIDPLSATLAITNASFVAQTVDWNPPHLFATLKAAHAHDGLAFVRILQRCPHYTPEIWTAYQENPDLVMLLKDPEGIPVDEGVGRLFKNQVEHSPRDLAAARDIAAQTDALPIGLLYRNPDAERYDLQMHKGLSMSTEDKLVAVQDQIDRFRI